MFFRRLFILLELSGKSKKIFNKKQLLIGPVDNKVNHSAVKNNFHFGQGCVTHFITHVLY